MLFILLLDWNRFFGYAFIFPTSQPNVHETSHNQSSHIYSHLSTPIDHWESAYYSNNCFINLVVAWRFVVFIFMCIFSIMSFFFQAEDGIRDYYASRGLGDVYKRQMKDNAVYSLLDWNRFFGYAFIFPTSQPNVHETRHNQSSHNCVYIPVSYTHLTLPTKLEV